MHEGHGEHMSDELLNTTLPGGSVILGPLVVTGDGSVAKGRYSFQPKGSPDWTLEILPAGQAENNYHLLNRVGAPIWVNASAVSDDGSWHHGLSSGWLAVQLPAHGTENNDLEVGDATFLVVHSLHGNAFWIREAPG
jgi:hypothetical protein